MESHTPKERVSQIIGEHRERQHKEDKRNMDIDHFDVIIVGGGLSG